MSRRLIDTKVGEYKANFFTVMLYAFAVIFGCAVLFWIPVIVTKGESVTAYTPVKFLIDEKFDKDSLVSYLMLAYVIYFGLLFLNLFLSISITKLRRSAYFKITKLVGFFLGLALISFHTYCLLNGLVDAGEYLYFYFRYQVLIAFVMTLGMVVYYHCKKISIYD